MPLQGNAKKLVSELNQTFIQNQIPALPGNSPPKLPDTFLDLAKYEDTFLESSTKDHFVLCHLKIKAEHDVNVVTVESTSQVEALLADV